MSDEMKNATSKLEEQSKKHKIALYYMGGDEERARQMEEGKILDLYVVKGNFSSSSLNGAFLVFLESTYFKFVHGFTVLLKTYELEELKTSRDWRSFEKELVEVDSRVESDKTLSNQVRDSMGAALTIQEITSLCKKFSSSDSIGINSDFKKIITDAAGLQNVKLQIDYEKISSLSMELHSLTSIKLTNAQLAAFSRDSKDSNENIDIETVDDPLVGRDVKLVLKGTLVLSPIKGKHIGSLVEGDRILVSIVDSNPKAAEVLKAFKAYDEEGNISPIPGRVIASSKENGYIVHVIVAKGIYVKIFEEEENIKVALDPVYSSSEGGESPEEVKKNGIKMLVLGLVFLTLVGTALFFVFVI